MAFQNIEKGIQKENINSRFKLAHVVSSRVRELCEPKEDSLPLQVDKHYKITANVVEEIIEDKVDFTVIEEKEDADIQEDE